MAVNLTRKTLVLAKTEGTPGTPESMDASSHSMLLFGDGSAAYGQDVSVLDIVPLKASLTQGKNLVGRTLANSTLSTYLMQGGPADSPGLAVGDQTPWLDPLLLACSLVKTSGSTTGSSSVDYKFTSESFQPCTINVYAHDILHQIVEAYGTFSLNCTAGGAPELTFNMQGTYSAPSNPMGGQPAAEYPTDTKAMCESEALVIGSYNSAGGLVGRSISLDAGVQVVERADVNSAKGLKGLQVSGRTPTASVVCEVEQTIPAAAQFHDDLQNAATKAVSWTHKAATTTYMTTTSLPQAQITGVDYGNDNDIRTYSISFKVQHSSDDSELTMSFIGPDA